MPNLLKSMARWIPSPQSVRVGEEIVGKVRVEQESVGVLAGEDRPEGWYEIATEGSVHKLRAGDAAGVGYARETLRGENLAVRSALEESLSPYLRPREKEHFLRWLFSGEMEYLESIAGDEKPALASPREARSS